MQFAIGDAGAGILKNKKIHRFWAALAIVSGDWRRLAEFLHVLLGLACVWRCSSSPVPFRYVLQICFVKMTREIEAPSGLDDVSSACWARSSFTRKRLASIHFTTCFIIMLWIETYKTTAFRMDAKSGFGNRSPAYRFRSFFRTEKGEKNWLKNAKTNSVAASLK